MDGVLVDFMAPICSWLNITQESVSTYKLEEMFPLRIKEIQEYYTQEGYFRNLKPYRGAVEFIKKLRNTLRPGDKIWLVSKPSILSSKTYSEKIDWIREYFPFLLETTILTQDKSLICLDLFVEDDIENLRQNMSLLKIIFDQPWNRQKCNVKRVHSYEELHNLIKLLS